MCEKFIHNINVYAVLLLLSLDSEFRERKLYRLNYNVLFFLLENTFLLGMHKTFDIVPHKMIN